MKLTISQLRNITLGAVRISEEDEGAIFHRFTPTEELLYKERDALLGRTFSDRCAAPAGIKLSFKTDSAGLKISINLAMATSRTYFSFDVFENGKLLGYLDNFNTDELPLDYTTKEFKLGRYEKSFQLSFGEKEISVYFPWSVRIGAFEIELDDNAYVEPVRPKKKALIYGDSITQGYDALRPHRRYAARLANALGAEEVNKAIGGEIFFPALADVKADFEPDYITVAYGTNDWSTTDGKSFYSDASSFFTSLSKNYPNAKIFAITPIWRANFQDEKPFGTFLSVEENIMSAVEKLDNVTVIPGFSLVGHDSMLFADLRLHPRDAGFDEYFENLFRKIGEYI